MDDEDLDIEIDKDIEAEFNAMFNKTNPKKEPTTAAPVKTATPAASFCNLEDFNPFDADTDDYSEEESSYDSYSSGTHVADTLDDEYMEKLNMVCSWCKEIMKKDELTDEEWHVVEACKEVVDCFL